MHSKVSADSSPAAPAVAKPVSYKGKTKGGPRMLEPPLGGRERPLRLGTYV
jgi:hypothetical protein